MERLKPSMALYFALSAFLLCPAMSLSQGIPDAKLIEGAKKEGRVVWYTSMILPHSTPLVARFEKKYPFVKTQLIRVGGGTQLNKILLETKGGLHAWDLSTARGEIYLPLRERKLLAPYRSPEANMIPEDMKDREGYWTALYITPMVLGFNTQRVKKENVPKKYEELLRTEWKGGKISIDVESWGLLTALSREWGKDKTLDFLRRLAAQEPHIIRGQALRANLLAAGEFPLAISYGQFFEEQVEKGGPVDWVPLEPVVTQVYPIMLAAKAPHPNAAKLFINFVLSKEAQEMIQDFKRIPSRIDVSPRQSGPIQYRRVVEDPEGLTNLDATIKLFNEIFGLTR